MFATTPGRLTVHDPVSVLELVGRLQTLGWSTCLLLILYCLRHGSEERVTRRVYGTFPHSVYTSHNPFTRSTLRVTHKNIVSFVQVVYRFDSLKDPSKGR